MTIFIASACGQQCGSRFLCVPSETYEGRQLYILRMWPGMDSFTTHFAIFVKAYEVCRQLKKCLCWHFQCWHFSEYQHLFSFVLDEGGDLVNITWSFQLSVMISTSLECLQSLFLVLPFTGEFGACITPLKLKCRIKVAPTIRLPS